MIGALLPWFFPLGGEVAQRYGKNEDEIEDLIGQTFPLKTFTDRGMPIDTNILGYHNFSTNSRGKFKRINLLDLMNYIDNGTISGSVGEHPQEFKNYKLLEKSFKEHQENGGNSSTFLSDPNNLSWKEDKYASLENKEVLRKRYPDLDLKNPAIKNEIFKKIASDPSYRRELNLHHTPEKTVEILRDMLNTGYNLKAPFVVSPLAKKRYGIIDGGHRVSNLLFLAKHGFIPKDDLKNYPISFIKMLPQLMNFTSHPEKEDI
jgi:hypothetical protein